MKHKIFSHTSLLIILSVILTFLAAGTVMYNRYDIYMKQGVRDEAAYIKTGLEEDGDVFLSDRVGDATSSRITLLGKDGQVLFDSIENPEEMENHSNRPEFIEAEKQGSGEMVRYSDTLSKQTFYYAVKLKDDQVLRVARTTDSLLVTMLTSFLLLGGLVCVILVIELFLVQKQTRKLIEPINRIDLEHPLEHVCYEELRPLLFRLDQQNRQIQKQLEDLKNAESARKEFTANVSHELKTPLMSISGYAELMMNGMVPPDKMQDFSGRIFHESERLSNLVADIIQLSRLDEKNGETMFEQVDIGELGEDVINNLQNRAAKKKINLEYTGEPAQMQGVRHVLYEMFYNITDNAIRYTPDGGDVKVFVGKLNGKPYFRVEDNGIGIPESEQQRIFERFYRVDKSHSRETGGTGLGLSIVKHGAVLHHAKILLDSAEMTGIIIFLIGVSSIMSWVMAFTNIPELVSTALLSVSSNKFVILFLINIILLIVGTFMDMTPACLIFTPIFLPVCTALGMTTIHFGIMMIFNLCIGTITPPVGTTLFVGVKVGKVQIETVFRQLLVYFAAIFIVLMLVTYIPNLSLWLPKLMGYI